MTRISRVIQGALLVSAIALTVTACGQKAALNGSAPSQTPQPTQQAQATQSPQPTATPEVLKQKKIKAYYTDENEIKLVEKDVTVSYKKDEDIYAAALKVLTANDDPKAVSLFDDVTFQSVAFDKEKGALKIDLKMGPNSQLGAPGEDLFLQALKKTAFQFAEVKDIYVLKDGKQVESLMGHMDLPYPIKRPN